MKFHMLQDNLRKMLWDKIHAGDCTGLGLAQQTGFQQAHLSNFLNHKRGLSLEAMDKVLSVLNLSVLDLIDPLEVNKRASIFPVRDGEFDNVVVVAREVAATQQLIKKMYVKQVLKFRRSFLARLKVDPGKRHIWDRFVIIKADTRDGRSMYPRVVPGATLLLDRHYNSMTAARKGEKNIYAVRTNDDTCAIGYLEVSGAHLILRPHNPSFPLEVMTLREGFTPADHIVGRVCHVGIEV